MACGCSRALVETALPGSAVTMCFDFQVNVHKSPASPELSVIDVVSIVLCLSG